MKFCKTLALLTAAVLFATSLVTGCGARQTPSASPSSAGSSSSTGVDTSEPLQLKMVMTGPEGADYKTIFQKINEKLKKDLNCTLDVTFLDWSEWQTKYPLMFASGEDFDLCYTSNWCLYQSEVQKGAFLELTEDDIKTYMPKTYANVTQSQWDGVKIQGNIYMVPQTGITFTNSHNVFLVRGDLMEKYGIKQITTADELTAYWDDVLKNDPDIIPIAINGRNWGVWVTQTIRPPKWTGANYYSYPEYPDNDLFQVVDVSDPNNVKTLPDSDVQEYHLSQYQLAKQFREKGYWSKDATTQTDDCLSMFQNGLSATAIRQLSSIETLYEIVNTAHPDWKPTIVDINPTLPANFYPITGDGMALHATTKHKERAMMVLDALGYDQSYYDLINYGIEGKDYTLSPDGTVSAQKSVDVGFRGMYNKIARISTKAAPNYKTLLNTFTKNGVYCPLESFNFNDSDVTTQKAAATSAQVKYETILAMGFADDVPATYAEYRKALDTAGLKDMQAAFLNQASTFMSSYNQ